jgi:hypothetical protein
MAVIADRIDISILPDNAANLLIDFYDFLVERYSKSKEESKDRRESDKKFAEFISKSVEVAEIIIPPRDEIHERKSFC